MQTFDVIGIDLTENCFSHGQLYVGFSRVGEFKSITIYSKDDKSDNVVYPEALIN